MNSTEIKEKILSACCEDDCPVWLMGEIGQLLNAFESAIRRESYGVAIDDFAEWLAQNYDGQYFGCKESILMTWNDEHTGSNKEV